MTKNSSSGSVILDRVLEALDAQTQPGSGSSLRQVADDSGLNYNWLLKVRQGVIRNPGIVQVERLFEYLFEEPPLSGAG